MTILALVILFAVYAFMDAGLEAVRAFSSGRVGPVLGHLLLGLIDLAAGIVALAWPGPTALVLVVIVAIWAFVGGFFELFAAFASGETPGTRVMFILAGLVSIAFGIVLAVRPGIGAVTLALLFGLSSLIYGVSLIVLGIQGRNTWESLHSVMADAARLAKEARADRDFTVPHANLPAQQQAQVPEKPADLRVGVRPGAPPVVEICGEIDIQSAPHLRDELLRVVHRYGSQLALDLGEVTFLDCAGINALLATRRRARLEDGWIRVIRVSPRARRIISLLGLQEAFALPRPAQRHSSVVG